MMSEHTANKAPHERTYTYREYLERYSGWSPPSDDNENDYEGVEIEENDPEKIGEQIGLGIIERLISGK